MKTACRATTLGALLVLLQAMGTALAQAPTPADLVLQQGRILRMASTGEDWASAVAVRAGRIVAVGGPADVQPFIGPATRVVDLQGRMAMPGLIDAHAHPIDAAYERLYNCALPPQGGLPEVLAAVKGCAARAEPGEWIVGAAYSSAIAPALEKRASLRLLDEASAGHPVLLRDDTFHNRWVNSEVLRRVGIRAGSVAPRGGHYVFDDGEPTGLLKEFPAFEPVQQLVPPRPVARLQQAAFSAAAELNAHGITTVQDAWVNRTVLDAWHRADRAPKRLPLRVVASLAGAKGVSSDEPGGLALVEAGRPLQSDRLFPTFVKFFVDGVPMAHTAAMLAPYLPGHAHGHDFKGQAHFTRDELVEQIAVLDRQGIPVKLHAVGDAAVRLSLDAIEVMRQRNGNSGPRHQVAHINWIAAADLPRFKALNVTAENSPMVWVPTPVTPVIAQVLGQERAMHMNPMRSMLEQGAPLAVGSDWPAAQPTADPWFGIEGLITRRNPLGHFPGVMDESQTLTLRQALSAYTRDNAKALGLDGLVGSIEVGKRADLIVLDQALDRVPANRIHRTRVLSTYLDGELVHEAPPAAVR